MVVLLQSLILYKLFAPSRIPAERPTAESAGLETTRNEALPSQATPVSQGTVSSGSASLRPYQNMEDCAEAEQRALLRQLILIRDGGATDPRLARRLERDLIEAQFVQQQMDSLFNAVLRDFQQFEALFNIDEGWPALAPSPTLDMRDLDNHYLVMFSLPGICSDDIRLRLDGRILTLLCSNQDASHPAFERRVMLPGEIDRTRETQARLTNGVLKVYLPKSLETMVSVPGEGHETSETVADKEML